MCQFRLPMICELHLQRDNRRYVQSFTALHANHGNSFRIYWKYKKKTLRGKLVKVNTATQDTSKHKTVYGCSTCVDLNVCVEIIQIITSMILLFFKTRIFIFIITKYMDCPRDSRVLFYPMLQIVSITLTSFIFTEQIRMSFCNWNICLSNVRTMMSLTFQHFR